MKNPLANRDGPADPAEERGVGFVAVLVSMTVLWIAYFLLATARGLVLEFDFQADLLTRRFVVTLAGIGVTVLLWLLLRGFDHSRIGLRVLIAVVAAVPASLLLAFINQKAFADVEAKIVRSVGQDQGVRIRRDEAGNLLVDVPGVPGDDAVVPPPPVPPPPVPPAPTPRPDDPGNRAEDAAAPETPAMPAPPATIVTEEIRGPDGSGTVRNVDETAGMSAEDEARMLKVEEPLRRKIMWQQLTDIALGRYFLLLSWCALYIAMGQAVQARVAERREGEYRRAAKAAELKSLRYQVNPHFLFNTLNSLSALVMTDRKEQAETMIQTISTFYRRSLSGDPTHDVPLSEEIELQRLYLQIEAVRFPDRLRIEVEVPEHLANARVPGMLLQPLVENSVRYAVAPVGRPVTIRLVALEEYGRLVIRVEDDGPGGSLADDSQHGFGIGLDNVRNRLKARFGDDASVASGPRSGHSTGPGGEHGWRTVIRMPLSFTGDGE
ncbi:histidine kinase [Croceicoccus sp. BE223]|uniref:histidine kinase n=1 Tax=Croceicoccus sp. BE223 TaxID=2817716 RepID=UPI0028558A11|nr:histidine kinase [Croceicoccus sp. BE223]MDR7102147.1 two-component sensor histidine kinase [Croceicoccus sp. BE223]